MNTCRVLFAGALVALAACSASDRQPQRGGVADAAAADANDDAGPIGVPACDDYIAKYETCIKEKVPPSSQPQLEQSLQQTIDSWKALAANPTTRAGLAAGCTQALETAKTAMSSYGCQF
jgi:hypothetical protein